MTMLAIIVMGGLTLELEEEDHELHEHPELALEEAEATLCCDSLVTSMKSLLTLLVAMAVICEQEKNLLRSVWANKNVALAILDISGFWMLRPRSLGCRCRLCSESAGSYSTVCVGVTV